MGDAGGEEADAGQPLGADQLPAALVDLLGQVAYMSRSLPVMSLKASARSSISSPEWSSMRCSKSPWATRLDALLQVADRVDDPAVEEPQQARHEQHAPGCWCRRGARLLL